MPVTPVDTLIHAGWIIPVVPAGIVLEAHSLAIQQGNIHSLLPTHEARRTLTARQVVELPQHALLPGLVNAHGHAAMSLLRGYADDFALMTWLQDYIWPAEARWVGSEFVRDGSALAIAEMLRAGTTCFSDMYFFPDATAAVAEQMGMRAQLTFPVLDFPTPWATNADEYIHKGLAVHDEYRHNPLVSIGFGPHAPYTVGDAPLARIAMLAAEVDAPIQIHAHETAHEVAESLAQHGERPLARLDRLGLLGPRTQCVHMTQVDDSDIALLAHHAAHVVHCPSSNLKLASGFCPVQRLREAGINVALGTDGAASNNGLDLWGELRTAALLGKAVANDAAALPAFAALEMATLNGARALGLDERIGSLEAGKAADLCAVDLQAIESLPLYQPVSQLVYTHSAPRVTHVWVAGRLRVENRQLLAADSDALLARARHWQATIAAH